MLHSSYSTTNMIEIKSGGLVLSNSDLETIVCLLDKITNISEIILIGHTNCHIVGMAVESCLRQKMDFRFTTLINGLSPSITKVLKCHGEDIVYKSICQIIADRAAELRKKLDPKYKFISYVYDGTADKLIEIE